MRILCVSGSRADFGGIEATYSALKKRDMEAHFATAAHDFGFKGLPDLVVVLGDRYEILKVVTDFFLRKIPIAHLSGGDITEGSQDDCMRHAITKMSHLHFPTSTAAAKVLVQLGEEPWRIHMVGYPGADNLVTYDKEIATKLVGADDYILAVWHPNTLVSNIEALDEAVTLTKALEHFDNKCLVLSPNFDEGGMDIANHLEKWCASLKHRYIGALPRDMFLTCMKYAKVMVGNSSSGFYEAPTFGTPVVNIGNRQLGRIVPPNMTHASIEVDDIVESIRTAMTMEQVLGRFKDNVYQTGNAADRIAKVISDIKDPKALLTKKFCHIT